MDILPVNNLPRIVDTRNDRREHPQRRQSPQKREKIKPTPVYTPDGHVEQDQVSNKIDVIA